MSRTISEPALQRSSVKRSAAKRRRNRIAVAVLGIALATVLLGGIVLALHWPFSKERITQSLQQAFPVTVTFDKFHSTYFPHPGCVAENVVFRRLGRSADLPPIATIERLTFAAHYSELFLRPGYLARVITDGFRIQVPALGTPLDETGWRESPSTIRIGEVDADGSSVQIARKDGKPPLVFDIHTLKLTSVSKNKAMSYAVFLNNALPSGEIRAHGEFGPWNSSDAGQTPASGEYTFNNADLGTFEGIAGMLGASGKFHGLLGHLETQGKIDIPDFMVKHSKHAVRVTIDYHAFVDGTNGDVALERVGAAFLKTRVAVSGKVAGTQGKEGKTTVLDLNVRDGRIQDVLRLFVTAPTPPLNGTTNFRAHVILPPGDQPFLRKVRLSADFGVAGGEFAKSSTQENVDSLSDKASKTNVGGKAPDEDADKVMSNIAGHVDLRGGTANFSNFSFEVPGASAQMHGTFNLENTAIDLHGTLKTEVELSQMTNGFRSTLLKPFNGVFKRKHAGAVVPVRLVGTYRDPHVGLDLPGAAVLSPGAKPSAAKN